MIKTYLVTSAIFLGIDAIWLGIISRKFYDTHLAAFERTLSLPPALLVYLLIPLGIVLFVLPKANQTSNQALLWGAIYGSIVYGVYDLTNLATLKHWSATMVVIDMLWGMFICGTTSYLVIRFTKVKKI